MERKEIERRVNKLNEKKKSDKKFIEIQEK